jgi:hypothetical protein
VPNYVNGVKSKVWVELEETARIAKTFLDGIVKPYRWNYALVDDLPEWYIKRW